VVDASKAPANDRVLYIHSLPPPLSLRTFSPRITPPPPAAAAADPESNGIERQRSASADVSPSLVSSAEVPTADPTSCNPHQPPRLFEPYIRACRSRGRRVVASIGSRAAERRASGNRALKGKVGARGCGGLSHVYAFMSACKSWV
jgi:hypothetical protein